MRFSHDARVLRAASHDATLRASGDLRNPAASAYDVVALRVEFQPDTSRFTTGDGTFEGDLFGGLEPSVDPLPHDAGYFQAHLSFLEDYVARVSDDKTVVRTHLIPDVVRLPYSMARYAPIGPDADSQVERAKLAHLVQDAWTAADAQSEFDMSEFVAGRTAFVIFHAGVGRDIELIGTTLDKTPEDIPSIFLGEKALASHGVLPAVQFNGFSIENCLILPRTETRLGTDFIADEPFLLELSINGLLAASFFNYLGVPDLFDVETGESAIGPFGLMDAQGIFAYGGLFPPEPMAWTKHYLGWTDSVDLAEAGPRTVALGAVSMPGGSPSARALISDAEYFLVENRYRDPERDGLTLRVWQTGSVVEQHVENGDETFNSAVIDGFIGGVVVGVDNYDWALPGGIDSEGDTLNGGFLVWHIDERRLRPGLEANAVNVGDHRAVDLEEADGAQDIGRPSSNPFAPRADLGTPFDFFFEGNPVVVETAADREVRLYENRFGPETHPDSRSNAGGPSFIVLEDFSDPAPTMSFVYRREAVAGIEPRTTEASIALQSAVQAADAALGPGSFVSSAAGLPVAYSRQAESVFVSGFERMEALSSPIVDDLLVRLHAQDEGQAISAVSLNETDVAWTTDLPPEVDGMDVVSPLVRAGTAPGAVYFAIFSNGTERNLVSADANGAVIETTTAFGAPLGIAAAADGRILIAGTEGAGYLDGDRIWTYDAGAYLGKRADLVEGIASAARPGTQRETPVFGRDVGGLVGVVPLPEEGRLLLLRSNGSVLSIDLKASVARLAGLNAGNGSPYPVLGDLDDDRRLDVLVAHGSHLLAFTQGGAMVAGFPVDVEAELLAQPLIIARGDDSGILAAGADGYLHGFDRYGRRLNGFPLEVGSTVAATPFAEAGRIVAASETGTIKEWSWPGLTAAMWGRMHGSEGNASFAASVGGDGPEPLDLLIDQSETYNWPNPVEEGETHLRIRTARDATVQVTIVDAAGSLVDEIDLGRVDAGVPTEVVWQADVQSGLYFVRFRATTAAGERETMLVKMAVIR